MRILSLLLLLICTLPLCAQDAIGHYYIWPAASATGQVGKYITFPNGPHHAYSIAWTTNGTPATCTFRVEGSNDAQSWVGIDAAAPSSDSVPCTSSNAVIFQLEPFRFVRVNVTAFTGAGTSATFSYAGGD